MVAIRYFLILNLCLFATLSMAQIGYGYVMGFDFYERFENPSDNLASPSAGNAILNGFAGPKMWIGGEEFSLSLETQINIGLTSLSVKEYKGLGSMSIPILAKLNFGGSTAFERSFETGYSVGGGIQWNRTELFYLSKKYSELGVQRKFFPTYIFEISIGKGGFGVDGGLYLRYGFNPDDNSDNLHVGMVFNINKNPLKNKSGN